ncbi:DNA-binding protein [Candidatus Protofrankia californiensis]|uniref:DNA-binding protein n=1 Tax=Candidatus Protofrankia californiensis TaxID=1839754 RepID=A0A1C3P552_9ACTN|nr:DNA-binding protein [Candidatus Protofrankia californiensis]
MTTAHRPRHCSRCGHRLAADNPGAMCSPCQSAAVDAQARPPAVPPEFWRLDQMRDALATWHMGRVIYAYRNHPYHRQTLSQELVGTWLGLTQAQLSRIENGRAPEELTKLIRYAQILGIPAELLWFDLPGSPRARTATEVRPPILMPVVLGGREVMLPIDADAAKANSLDTVIDGLLARTGDEPGPAAIRGASPGRQAARILPFAGLDEMRHMAAALNDARRYLDGSVVGFFARQFERCKADDGQLGPLRVLPLVLGILGAIQQYARDVQPKVRRDLLAVGADGAEFVGWLYRDLHDPGSAAYWYDRAMEWAQEAGDLPMQGYILLRKSQMAYTERDALRVLTLAQAAQYGPWQLPPHVRAEVTQQEARGLAMTGEPIEIVERKLNDARTLLATADADDVSLLGAQYDEGTWLLRSASCYVEAGKPRQAAMLYGEVLATSTLARRDEGYYRARRAVACALGGEPDEAAQEGLEALRLAASTNSQRTNREVARVVEILAPWQGRSGPRELRAVLGA